VQQPPNTSRNKARETLLNYPVAVGVEIIVEVVTGSPLIAIAREIAPAVPVVGSPILPPNEMRKRALR
jgi:hypothetical protein